MTAGGDEQTRFRFTARVEFDDHIVGDVTAHHDLTWTAAGFFRTDDAAVTALENDALRGRIRIPAALAVGGPPTPVTAALPAAWGGATATATFGVAAPWEADAARPKAELFSIAQQTSLGAAAAHPENVANVLFVPTGYTTANLPAFEAQTAQLLHAIRMDPLSKPFDVLADSMNMWRVLLASPVQGTCVLTEVYTRDVVGLLCAQPIPESDRPDGDEETLGGGHLLYLAGLPMPNDAKASIADLRSRWAQTWPTGFGLAPDDPWPTGRGLDPLDTVKCPDDQIEKWRDIATRTFVDEMDSPLPACIGFAPEDPWAENMLFWIHPDRGGVDLLNAFVTSLEAASGATIPVPQPNTRIGALWSRTPAAGIRFQNFGTIGLIYGVNGGGHPNAGFFLKMGYDHDDGWLVAAVPGRNAVAMVPTPMPTTLSPMATRVFVHEFGHRFGLGDEYPSPSTFHGTEADLDVMSNVTSLAGVQLGGHFNSRRIKWNWDRIAKAAVLAAPLAPTGGTGYDAPLHPGQAKAFAPNEVVRLRARRWRTPIGFVPHPAPTFNVASIAGDTLKLQYVGTAGFDAAAIGEGSVVYVPAPAPDSVRSAADPYARMISVPVEQHIDEKDAPLTSWPSDAKLNWAEWKALHGLQWPLNFGGFIAGWSYRFDARLVGLYEGGAHAAAGTFHPAGMCRMRSGRREFWSFCPVCRYAIVDFVDPSRHGDNDLEYAKQYPT
jgi:hypothetical protein